MRVFQSEWTERGTVSLTQAAKLPTRGGIRMPTVTREPIDAFAPLRQAVNRFMEDGMGGPERALFMLGRTFPVDVLETPDEYVIEASLLGIRPEDVQITTAGNTITIRAGRKAHKHDEKE